MPIKKTTLIFSLIYGPTLGVLAAVALAAQTLGIPFGNASRDLAAIAGVHPLAGFLSNIGILLWCAAATVCLCAAYVARRRGDTRVSRFLFFSGLFTAVLLCDDFFLVHEQLAPSYLGLHEDVVVASYALALLCYAWVFRAEIWRTEFGLLFAAAAFFAVSIGLDALNPGGRYHLFIEDGAKLLGLANWLAYYLRTSLALALPDLAVAGARRSSGRSPTADRVAPSR